MLYLFPLFLMCTESPNPLECGGNNYDSLVFSTGSGKPVTLKPSSVQKALSILDGNSLTTGYKSFFTYYSM